MFLTTLICFVRTSRQGRSEEVAKEATAMGHISEEHQILQSNYFFNDETNIILILVYSKSK